MNMICLKAYQDAAHEPGVARRGGGVAEGLDEAPHK